MNHNIVPNLSLTSLLAILQTYLSPHWGGAEGAGDEPPDIESANLPPATERLAHRLLARCHPDNGHVTLTWDEFLSIAGGLRNRGAAGKHLTRLKQANLIHYSTNASHVYITFRAWLDREGRPNGEIAMPEVARTRGELVEGDEASLIEATPTDAPVDEKSGAEPDEPARARARLADATPLTPPNVCLSSKDSNDPETDKHVVASVEMATQKPDTERTEPSQRAQRKTEEELSIPCALGVENSERQIDEEQQKRNYALLTDPDVGISGQVAELLASQHEFEWLLKQVFAWRRDQQRGKVNGTGALIHRLRCGWSAAPLSREEKRSDLYTRHCGTYDPWVGCEGQIDQTCQVGSPQTFEGPVFPTCPPDRSRHPDNLHSSDIDLARQTIHEVTRNHPLCRELAIELDADTLIIRGVQQALTLLERAATMIGRRLRAAWGRPVQVVVEPIGA